MDCVRITARFVHVRFGGFPPEQIGIRRTSDAASDGCVETSASCGRSLRSYARR